MGYLILSTIFLIFEDEEEKKNGLTRRALRDKE
jgi:hypothetical protein